jgi:hypothetical protein
MLTPAKHTIVIDISPTGEINSEVQGVAGPDCGKLSKWLDELGKVTRDEHSKDYYKRPEQGVVVKQ